MKFEVHTSNFTVRTVKFCRHRSWTSAHYGSKLPAPYTSNSSPLMRTLHSHLEPNRAEADAWLRCTNSRHSSIRCRQDGAWGFRGSQVGRPRVDSFGVGAESTWVCLRRLCCVLVFRGQNRQRKGTPQSSPGMQMRRGRRTWAWWVKARKKTPQKKWNTANCQWQAGFLVRYCTASMCDC